MPIDVAATATPVVAVAAMTTRLLAIPAPRARRRPCCLGRPVVCCWAGAAVDADAGADAAGSILVCLWVLGRRIL